MSTVLPFRGEFGLKVRYHVPAVFARGFGLRIIIEEGEEALYPLAQSWQLLERRNDDERRGWTDPMVEELRRRCPDAIELGKGLPEERFLPRPHVEQRTPPADVVICPRQRKYGSSKNWPFWASLLRSLKGDEISVFAAGAPDSSDDLDCPRAWDYARFLDATIEAMLGARLVVATDAGLAHLAVLCGRPLLLISHEGLVAPGPVLDDLGDTMEPRYWPVRLEDYYDAANHTGSPIYFSGAWMSCKLIKEQVDDILGNHARAGRLLERPPRS